MLIWLSVFIILIVSLLIFKLSGAILTQFLFSNENFRQSVFVQVLTSLTVLTITYACIKSSFQTIYSLPFFVILFYTTWSVIKNYRLFSIHFLFNNIYQIFIPVIFISSCYIIFFVTNSGHEFIIGHDHAFFGYHSFELAHFGVENRSGIFNDFSEFSQMRHLYHYADLWLISLISELSNIHNFYIVFLYVPILSISMLYMFVCQFYNKLKVRDHLVLLSLMMGTFLCIPYFSEIELFNSTFNMGRQSFWTFSKYFFIIGIFLFYFLSKYNKNTKAEFIFLFLPFLHSGAAPLGMFLLLFLYFNYLFEGLQKLKDINHENLLKRFREFIFKDQKSIFLFRISLSYLIISVGIFIYYSVGDDYSKNVLDFSDILSLSYMKLLVIIGGKTIFDSLLVCAPFILFIWLNRKIIRPANEFISLKILLMILFSGFCAYLLFNYSTNEAYQFFYYVFFTILPIYFISKIFEIYMNRKNKLQLIGVLVFSCYALFSFYNTQVSFHSDYLSKDFKNELKNVFERRGALDTPGAIFYKSEFNSSRQLRGMQDYQVLGMVHPGLYYARFSPLPDISGFSIPLMNDVETYDKSTNAYSVYCRKNNVKKDYSEASILRAFEYFNICWLVETPNSYTPNYIKSFIDTTIIDHKRKTKIHFLKKW